MLMAATYLHDRRSSYHSINRAYCLHFIYHQHFYSAPSVCHEDEESDDHDDEDYDDDEDDDDDDDDILYNRAKMKRILIF